MAAAYVSEIHKIISAANAAADERCLYFDRDGKRCKCTPIRSHSLQKNGPLASIAENGHVIRVSPALRAQKIEDRAFFERVGVRNASTFLGFCNQHDTEVFSEIETLDGMLPQRAPLLFAIRSFALEHRHKQTMVALQKETIRNLLEAGKKEKIEIPSLLLRGATAAVVEGEARLKKAFAAFHKVPLPNFLFVLVEFEHEAPFAITGAFEPDWSLDNEALYAVDPMKTKWNTISMFCGNIKGRHVACISGSQQYRHHRIDRFLQSLVEPDRHTAPSLFSVALAHSENCFIQQGWYETLPQDEIRKIVDLMRSGVLDGIRDPSAVRSRVQMPNNAVTRFVTNLE
jgi:hypothetical protein